MTKETKNTNREIIPVDSVKIYGETAIVQLPVTAWTTMTSNLKKHAAIRLQVPAYRNIRDRMFRSLFSEKKELLSLYNAVSDRDYTNPDDLEIVTLEGAIYMGMKNDISFIISNGLYLYEHQSTDNINMPLRDLFYIAEQYRVLTVHENLYSSRKISLPNPHFVVLFNGETEKPDTFEYRLSDLFASKEDAYDLDLKVRIININKGHNPKMMARCRTLEEFARFVDILRGYNKTMDIGAAIHLTIEDCIAQDILKDYLLRNKAEVYDMVLYDFDVEKYKEDRENEIKQLADELERKDELIKQLQAQLAETK